MIYAKRTVNEDCKSPNAYVWSMRTNLGINGLGGVLIAYNAKISGYVSLSWLYNGRNYPELLAFTASLLTVVVAPSKIKAIV